MTAEAGREFVDTNVAVYAFDPSSGDKHDRARALITELFDSGLGATSVQVLQEFFVTITRKVAVPTDVAKARRGVGWLTRLRVHEPRAEDVLAAIDMHRDHGISFWDAMVLRSASRLGCEVVWTEDLNDGQTYGGVRVADPFGSSPGRGQT